MKAEKYIRRALDLAQLGAGAVAPNPMVGAVIVHKDRIIGEGWHQEYGQAHAEVNAVNSVLPQDKALLEEATIYVSLEPCTIFGRTPPCANLIIDNKIPRVVISTVDKTDGVNGTSQSVLEAAGVQVEANVLKKEGDDLAIIRNTFVSQQRPYIILKYAQSADGFMGQSDRQVWLTNPISKRLVHKWRSEAAAIIVGTNTAIVDNPQLNTRHYFGMSPLRIVLDKNRRIPSTHHLLQDEYPTWILSKDRNFPSKGNKTVLHVDFGESLLTDLLKALAEANKTSLIVEGGASLLQSFIDANLWDECRLFTTKQHLGKGIAAPKIDGRVEKRLAILEDTLTVMKR